MRLRSAVLAGAIVVSVVPDASAGINSYGSGLYPSQTLSTPPSRRHGDNQSSRKTRSYRQNQTSTNSGKAHPK